MRGSNNLPGYGCRHSVAENVPSLRVLVPTISPSSSIRSDSVPVSVPGSAIVSMSRTPSTKVHTHIVQGCCDRIPATTPLSFIAKAITVSYRNIDLAIDGETTGRDEIQNLSRCCSYPPLDRNYLCPKLLLHRSLPCIQELAQGRSRHLLNPI